MIEIALLAQQITTFVAPFLPTLLRLGEKAEEEVVTKAVGQGWDKAHEMWDKIPHQDDPAIQIAATNLATKQLAAEQHPDDPAKRQALEIYKTVFQDALGQVLEKNSQLAAVLEEDCRDEVVQRQIALRGSEISGVEQSVEGPGKVTQEAVAEDNSRITNSKFQVKR